MIGNDVVDLKLAKNQSNWQRKGFLEKQFTVSEIHQIYQSENPFLQVWTFWSMKEAAYKCFTQKCPKRFFAPIKFQCKQICSKQGMVFFKGKNFSVKIEISDSYIYSVALERENENIKSELFPISVNHQSKTVNSRLLNHFKNDTFINKNSFGVPYLVHQQEKLPFSISISHHGNFGAYAILEY